MADEAIRSFIAVELPAEMIGRLKDFQAGLKSQRAYQAKWVDPGSMHLTLKFLGNVGMKRMAAVKDGIGAAVSSSRRFHLATAGTGFFPDAVRPRVFWLGLEGDMEALAKLHRAIDEEMSKLGYARENRPFTAHLTLARLRDESGINDRIEFARSVQGHFFKPPCDIHVNSVALMRSQLTPRGAVYTRLAEFALPDADQQADGRRPAFA